MLRAVALERARVPQHRRVHPALAHGHVHVPLVAAPRGRGREQQRRVQHSAVRRHGHVALDEVEERDAARLRQPGLQPARVEPGDGQRAGGDHEQRQQARGAVVDGPVGEERARVERAARR
jgi:hypothetical protein